MDLDLRLNSLKDRVATLERFIHLFASSLDDPAFEKFDHAYRVYRYRQPDVRHYCLLKAARAVSAINATIALCRAGFTQEICVLLRTVVECTSHIDFVLSESDEERKRSEFISEYFADCDRFADLTFRKPSLRQGEIHAVVGKALDGFLGRINPPEEFVKTETSKLYSTVYRALSNYVHCRYPETMDLYGGNPGTYHLRGMSGTSKDLENIELLETYFTSVSHALQSMILKLNLLETVNKDAKLAAWVRSWT